MTPKELLFSALQNKITPRPAWVPFVGVHGAHLLGKSAEEYLKSSDLIVQGLRLAKDIYKPDGLPVMFDLQIEAEMLGCGIKWSKDAPPAVVSHPLSDGKSIADLPEFDPQSGRMAVALDTLQKLKKECGDEIGLYGLICGPFTLSLHLLGTNIFLDMFDRPSYVKSVIAYCAIVACKAARAYAENGADVVAVVDPMTSQISPEHFNEFVAPYLDQVFNEIRKCGVYSSLFVCGDANRILDLLSNTACDNVSIDENIPLTRTRDITRSHGKSFGGNIKLTTVLLLGDSDDSKLDALRCIDEGGSSGFVLAPGCDLPFAVPKENVAAVAEMVHDDYQREIARRTIVGKNSFDGKADIPDDYKAEKQVHLDVVTLDSGSCAPCQYMVDAVRKASLKLSRPVIIKEHKVTTHEGIATMQRLGVKNIPTICIDGEIAYVSRIPDINTLVRSIENKLAEKII
jgi:uroporphyrinogen decarboxylase